MMGEIKVALKKEVKTEGDQLVLEILQCRNITYKFKSPDHLPGLEMTLLPLNVLYNVFFYGDVFVIRNFPLYLCDLQTCM